MKKIVFILGSGHCGSTLLDLMLDAHPLITGVGEMHGLKPEAVCTCGKHPEECLFWSVVAEEDISQDQQVFRSKTGFLLNTPGFRSSRTRQRINAERLCECIIRMYERMGTKVIVDSSKSVDRAALLVSSLKIEPYVIHLVRDGRAVTWSYIRKYKRWFPYLFKWAAENIKIEIFKHRTKTRKLLVRYEDLAEHPERELKRIAKWIDEPYDPSMLDFRSGAHHQIGGNRMRFDNSSKITPDAAWRHDMPVTLRFAFNVLFGWLNALYYRPARS